MKQAYAQLEYGVRWFMRQIAKLLNSVFAGHLSPNMVTYTGLAMHLPIAYFIATGRLVTAGILLIIFGLFDTLDGELARLQKRTSDLGGFLDASTDRVKEVMLYCGAAYFFSLGPDPRYSVWAVAACGASICVSFVKAKGEAVMAAAGRSGRDMSYAELNRLFASGFFNFQVRMAVLVLGLFTGYLVWAVAAVAVMSTVTVVQRFVMIGRKIR